MILVDLHLVLVLSHHLLLLKKFLPIGNTAVTSFLSHFHPAASFLSPEAYTNFYSHNWYCLGQNLHFRVSATITSCFRLHLGSATLVAGPLPTSTSKYLFSPPARFFFAQWHLHTMWKRKVRMSSGKASQKCYSSGHDGFYKSRSP